MLLRNFPAVYCGNLPGLLSSKSSRGPCGNPPGVFFAIPARVSFGVLYCNLISVGESEAEAKLQSLEDNDIDSLAQFSDWAASIIVVRKVDKRFAFMETVSPRSE